MNVRNLHRTPYLSIVVAFGMAILPVVLLYQGSFMAYLAQNKTLADTLVVLPYFFLGVSVFLGWKMNQLSIVFSAIVFGMCYVMLAPPVVPETLHVKVNALGLMMPLSLMLIFLIPHGRLIGTSGMYMVASTAVPFGIVRMLMKLNPEAANKFFGARLLNMDYYQLPEAGLLFFSIFFFLSFRQTDKDLKRYSFSALFCVPPLLYLLNRMARSGVVEHNHVALFFSAIGMVCVYAMYQVYWQKIYIDQLTEIPNRRALDEALLRMGRFYTIVMVDIDHFKKFNDNYGHEEGDNVLRYVAFHLSDESGGRAYRYGGEEFCLLYNGKDADEVHPLVDEIREKLASKDFYIREQRTDGDSDEKTLLKEAPKKVKVTISLGVASPSQQNPFPEAVRKAADRSLYEAKANGRNQTVVDIGHEWDKPSKAIV